MNTWQKRFAQKIETVRNASRSRFEDLADETLAPVFDEFSDFASRQGLQASAPLANPGVRTFKFAMAENAYVLMTFRLDGLDHCALSSEFFVPAREKVPPLSLQIELHEAGEAWVRQAFEQSLDHFADAFVETLAETHEGVGDLIDA